MDMLCAELHTPIQWRIVGNGWYECKGCSNVQPPTMVEPVVNCPKCKAPWEFIRMNEDRVSKFRDILTKAQQLMHFDTRSGVVLELGVNPTGNVMKNMPYALGTKEQPALKMKDFVGTGIIDRDKPHSPWHNHRRPAICVSAGPSLDDEIENLKRLSQYDRDHEDDKFRTQHVPIIICVARVYKKLRDAGIRVDYTYSCEMFDWDSAIFDDVGDPGETILCYPPVVAPMTVQKWPGKRLCTWDINSAYLVDAGASMMGGNSVSHHILNFALEILGCEPAILVGQDLAYTKPDGRTHALGSDAKNWPDEVKAQDTNAHGELKWAPCTGKGERFCPERHRQSVLVGAGKPHPVGDMEVFTSQPYINFGTLFEILIARHKKKVLNACGEGLKIAGTEYVNLAEWKP
jgi:hypothetical protein